MVMLFLVLVILALVGFNFTPGFIKHHSQPDILLFPQGDLLKKHTDRHFIVKKAYTYHWVWKRNSIIT